MSFRLTSVGHTYEGEADAALDGITLDIPADRRVAVLGPSGAGKTTLLHLLGLLLPVARGDIHYEPPHGKFDYRALGESRRLELRRRRFGYALQNCYLLPNFSCLDNVAMPLRLRGTPAAECRERVMTLFALTGDKELAARATRRGESLSAGQRQRVAVLRAVVHDPDVIFADEPTSNLDPKNADAILQLLARWQAGGLGGPAKPRGLVVVCHHVESALRLVGLDGRMIVLHRDLGPIDFDGGEWTTRLADLEARLGPRLPPTPTGEFF